ncbi:hypothetical protein [Xanthomonas sp. SI]|uniref:hypothetical protein n=1 Tax=Xanthomonas sp. SI TaxID=2724123 RepID=UPI00163AAE31|nr:hypothetical protein [Xanthomonas sp. SI]
MSAQKKRHGEAAVASSNPENPSHREEAHEQNASLAAQEHLAHFPPDVFKRSAAWHLDRAHHARSVGELKHHLRAWAIRWACYTRGIGSHFVEYGQAMFASAIATSGLRVRFRAKDVRELCSAAAHIMWG